MAGDIWTSIDNEGKNYLQDLAGKIRENHFLLIVGDCISKNAVGKDARVKELPLLDDIAMKKAGKTYILAIMIRLKKIYLIFIFETMNKSKIYSLRRKG